MGGEERVARQHASGQADGARAHRRGCSTPGSFHETGALAGAATYDERRRARRASLPANMVVGQGASTAARVVVQGDDFTVRGGAADAAIWQKMVWAERAAHDLRLPLVRLVDGTGGGGSVKTLETMGFSYVPPLPGFELAVDNLARVPVVAAALGPCAGLGAARVVLAHFSVIVRGHARSCSSPGRRSSPRRWASRPTRRQLGGARAQTRAGAVDNEAADEDDALAQLRRFLSYLPAERLGGAAGRGDRPTRPTAARRSCCRSSRATRASPTTCAASSSSSSTAAASSSSGARFGRLADHRARPARRAPGRRAGLRPQALRRRPDRRRRREARALHRPLRPVPPARSSTSSTSPAS